MKKPQKKNSVSKTTWLVIGIVIFVGLLLAAMLFAQQSFSHKISQISFTLSSGPVSPEFQQTTRLVLTPSSCEISVTKVQPQSNETKNCPMDSTTFEKIQASTINYGVIDKIISNSDSSVLIGGKQASIAIELQNGTTFSTKITPQFYTDMGPYFEEIELLTPSLSQVLPSQ